jgi:hypothetical protein
MTEEFLQYIWKHQLIEKAELKTKQGDLLQIVHPGTLNTDAGPDFFNASIMIGDTLWAGNVEVHLKSSDWNKHGHQHDAAYNNVILHVVFDHDAEVVIDGGRIVPAFVPVIDSKVIENYEYLLQQKKWPACSKDFNNVDPIYRSAALNAMLVQRLQSKTKLIERLLNQNNNHWNETFYQHLAMTFGLKTNGLPFEMLTRSLPLRILSKHKDNLLQLEALIFGQSGLLNERLLGDDYFLQLREEYQYLAAKYQLKSIESHLWKFHRLRPANFPTIRMAQFAALINQSESLFSKLMEIEDIGTLMKLFQVKASRYWDVCYRFNQKSIHQEKWLGKETIHLLMINSVVPFLFLYGERNGKEELKERAFYFLEQLPAESNSIIRRWSELGFKAESAYATQALIQLKNVYCEPLNCLKCQIGNKILHQ